jgi:hypothetical protein
MTFIIRYYYWITDCRKFIRETPSVIDGLASALWLLGFLISTMTSIFLAIFVSVILSVIAATSVESFFVLMEEYTHYLIPIFILFNHIIALVTDAVIRIKGLVFKKKAIS